MSKHNRRSATGPEFGNGPESVGDEMSPTPGVASQGIASQGVDIATGEVKEPAKPAEPPKVMKAEFLKKIVAKALVDRKDLRFARVEKDGRESKDENDYPPRALYRVYGTAQGTETGESQYGPWTCFTGSFEAIRLKDHKRFRSNKVFLQDPAEGLLIEAIRGAKLVDASASVRFGFDIGVKVSARWLDTDEGNSYEYTVESIFDTEEADPLAALRGAALQALPPPSAS